MYLIMPSVKQGGIKSLVWHDLGMNPGLPDHWQTLYPLGNEPVIYIYIYIYIYITLFLLDYYLIVSAGHCWRSRDELISDVLLWTPHMARQKQDDQLEHTYSSYVRIRDVALKTCQRRWTIGRSGERGSGISVPVARDDDDDDDISITKTQVWRSS